MRQRDRYAHRVDLTVLLLAALACAGTRPTAPSEKVQLLLQLPADVRPLRYALDMEIVPSRERFRGTVDFDVELSLSRQVFWLHARDLGTGSAAIEVPGSAALPAFEQVTSESVTRLTLPPAVGPRGATLHMTWSGVWGDGQVVGLYRTLSKDDRYPITHFESINAECIPALRRTPLQDAVQLDLVNDTHKPQAPCYA